MENALTINEEHINTIAEDRLQCVQLINGPDTTPFMIRLARAFISSITSSQANELYEEQLSKILGIRNIDTKHGWDGNDDELNEPYEYKPTKITGTNYLGAKVSINDDSMSKVNNCSPHKEGLNNENANFVIAVINQNTSEFICIYKFKERVLKQTRINKIEDGIINNVRRIVYGTNINKCIALSNEHNEGYHFWINPNSS